MLSDLGLLAILFSFWVFYPGIIFIVAMLAFVANELPGRYFAISILVFALVLQLLAGIPILVFIVAHPIWILIFVALYLPFGILYSRYYELPRFCRRVVEYYNEEKKEFFNRLQANRRTDKDGKEQTAEEAWIENCKYKFPQFHNGTFSIRSYKGKIFTWVVYWPWFLVWRLMYDFLKEIWDIIYLQIQHIYQAVADRIYKDILSDLLKDPKPKQ